MDCESVLDRAIGRPPESTCTQPHRRCICRGAGGAIPSPRGRGRIADVFLGAAQSDVRAGRATEPTEGARGNGAPGRVARDETCPRAPPRIRARAAA